MAVEPCAEAVAGLLAIANSLKKKKTATPEGLARSLHIALHNND
jgi:hypothetical protein